MAEPAHVDLGETFHLTWPRWKHEENSERGCDEAVRTGHSSIDIDTQFCLTALMATHWPHPMLRDDFIDPEHKINPHTPILHLTYEQVARLVSRHGNYHILTARHLLTYATDHGLKVRLEVKAASAHRWTLDFMTRFKAFTDTLAEPVVIATLSDYPGWDQVLRNARRVGYDTRNLGRG